MGQVSQVNTRVIVGSSIELIEQKTLSADAHIVVHAYYKWHVGMTTYQCMCDTYSDIYATADIAITVPMCILQSRCL